jgi:uncharacterized protein YycO
MNKFKLSFLLLIAVSLFSALAFNKNDRIKSKNGYQTGDIIFHTSKSAQSKAIQLTTKSKYSHCGLIYKLDNKYYVYEAVGPVKLTPLDIWIARGSENKFVVKRLINAAQILTPSALKKLKQEGDRYNGKKYDTSFEWSDDKIYCSELVWKMYKKATGLEIGKTQKLNEFDLTSTIVKGILQKRYGKNVPLNEVVISPQSIFESNLLFTVSKN